MFLKEIIKTKLNIFQSLHNINILKKPDGEHYLLDSKDMKLFLDCIIPIVKDLSVESPEELPYDAHSISEQIQNNIDNVFKKVKYKYVYLRNTLNNFLKIITLNCKVPPKINLESTLEKDYITKATFKNLDYKIFRKYSKEFRVKELENGIGTLDNIINTKKFFITTFPILSLKDRNIDNLRILIDMFYFSLIINSSVTNKDALESIYEIKLSDIEPSRPYRNVKSKDHNKNIIMDPFSQIILYLISYMYDRGGETTLKPSPNYIDNCYKYFEIPNYVNKFRLKELIESMKILNLITLPPYIFNVINSKFKNVSMDFQIIYRETENVHQSQFLAISKLSYRFKKDSPKESANNATNKNDIHLIKIGKELLDAINEEKLNHFASKYKDLLEGYNTIRLLYEWVTYLLNKKKRSLNTVRDYFSGFYKDLITLTKGQNLMTMYEDQFSDLIYSLKELRINHIKTVSKNYNGSITYISSDDDAKNEIKKETESKVIAKIKSFFRWFITKVRKDISEDILEDMEYSSKLSKTIRNSIIFDNEFKEIIKKMDGLIDEYLIENFKDLNIDIEKIKKSTYFIFILGYYTGMRKSEILNIRIKDCSIGIESYIYVRKSKTDSSKRKVLIKYLLPPEILDEFESFHIEKRKNSKSIDFLFYSSQDELLVIQYVIQLIVNYIKEFINDQNFVFHSLRHSFASNMLLRYYYEYYPEFRSFIREIDEKGKFSFEDYKEGNLKKIFGNDIMNHNKFMMVFSTMIGHLSPEETIEVYIHTFDLVILFHLRRRFENVTLSRGQLLNLSPYHSSKRATRKNSNFKEQILIMDFLRYLGGKNKSRKAKIDTKQ